MRAGRVCCRISRKSRSACPTCRAAAPTIQPTNTRAAASSRKTLRRYKPLIAAVLGILARIAAHLVRRILRAIQLDLLQHRRIQIDVETVGKHHEIREYVGHLVTDCDELVI